MNLFPDFLKKQIQKILHKIIPEEIQNSSEVIKLNGLKYVKYQRKRSYYIRDIKENVYICTVFFMVLDLRLTMEIGCRDDNLFLL